MTPEQARQLIIEALAEIAPDGDPAALAPDADVRAELELDSLDFLTFVEALGDRTGRRIEEDDYPRISTLAGGAQFLAGRLAAPNGGPDSRRRGAGIARTGTAGARGTGREAP